MKLALAIMDFILVAMQIYLATENKGASRKLNIICAVLWLICGIINLGLFITAL